MNEMIDPKSLRIGNYLLHDGKVIVVTDIRSNELPEHGYKGSVSGEILDDPYRTHVAPWLAKCSGIPLSEQELIRLGAIKCKGGEIEWWEMTTNGWLRIYFREEGIFPQLRKEVLNEVLYVHQLQNLYYSLTGTELTYKVENETIKQ